MANKHAQVQVWFDSQYPCARRNCLDETTGLLTALNLSIFMRPAIAHWNPRDSSPASMLKKSVSPSLRRSGFCCFVRHLPVLKPLGMLAHTADGQGAWAGYVQFLRVRPGLQHFWRLTPLSNAQFLLGLGLRPCTRSFSRQKSKTSAPAM